MDREIINNIKALGIDMISEAKSGHPGIVLGAAPIIYTVYAKHMNINISDPNWINRDRFVMSAGHGSALLYATLYMAGYNLSLDDLKNFRKIGSKTPGHPEYGITPGVECSTGPLGQGIATAVGMALAGKILEDKFYLTMKNKFNRVSKENILDHNIYVLCGDGDLMEGVCYEAASLAGSWKLNNLIVLYDSNHMSLDGNTTNTFSGNVMDRFKAMGWHTDVVSNGESVSEIDKAIEKATDASKPSIIEIKTILGRGSLLENTNAVHGKPLSNEDIRQIKQKLGWAETPFVVSERAKEHFTREIATRSSKKYDEWAREYRTYLNDILSGDNSAFGFLYGKHKDIDLINYNWMISEDEKMATRDANEKVMKVISDNVSYFLGGSADLASSVKTYLEGKGDISYNNYNQRNIWFGVREHAMGAILNGLALSNFRVYGSTFLSFSDYLKPAIRMSALMHLPVTYIFSHDSISNGEDGPTHQPVEQLTMLRSTPNLNVFRPADIKEVIGSWNYILKDRNTPSALILSKQVGETLKETNANEVAKGAYIINHEEKDLHGIIIATGDEARTAVRVAKALKFECGLDIRVVSMPSQELFERQNQEYKDSILPLGVRTIVIEAGSKLSWYKYVYNDKYLITIDNFGISGSKDEVLKYFNYDYESIKNRVKELL